MKRVNNTNLRNTGIKIVGQMPWGTHLCQFYQTKRDLLEILIPYFKAGLKNNEFCMWVTSEPLSAKEAKDALKKGVKSLDRLLKKGQIEILDYSQWYKKGGRFNANKVLAGWIEKERHALRRGFSGLRLTGNTFWLEKKDWKNFTEYEAKVNNTIGGHRMLALCTYSLDKCNAAQVIDVVNNHQFALIKREGKWVSVESSSYRKAADNLKEVSHKYELLIENIPLHIAAIDRTGKFIIWNKYSEELFDYKKEESIGKLEPKDLHPSLADAKKVIRTAKEKGIFDGDLKLKRKDGSFVDMRLVVIPYKDNHGNIINYYGFGENITERKRAEESLKLERKKLETIIENSPVAIAVTDAKGGTILSNSSFETIWGKNRPTARSIDDYVKYKAWWVDSGREVLPEEWASAKVIRTGEPVVSQLMRIERFDGTKAFINNSAAPIYDVEGRLIGSVVAILDVTEREKAEEKIAHLASFPEHNPNPVMEITYSGKIRYENPVTAKILRELGVSDKKPHPFIPLDLSEILKDAKENGVTVFEREMSVKDRVFIESISILPQFEAVRIYARDITKRKQAEQLIQRSHQELEKLVKERTQELRRANEALEVTRDNLNRAQAVAHIGSWYLGIVNNVLAWSDETYRIFGLDIGSPLTYEKFIEIVHPDDREYVNKSWQGALQKEPYDIEHRIIVYGNVKWVREKAQVEFDKRGKAISGIGTVQDITEYKQQEENLRKLQGDLTHMSRVTTMGELTAALAHELNQPLMAIISNAQAAQRFMAKGNPDLNEIKDILSDIIKDDKRASDVINKLRALLKKSEIEFTTVNINEVIRDVISLVHSDIVIKNISLNSELNDEIPLVSGDRVQLQQVILNLILNSFEAMKDMDSKRLFIRSSEKDDKFITVTIEDTGVGIDDKNMGLLFKPFFTTKKEGLGMGLAINKAIIESHGGSLWAENNSNKGATFYFTLPIAKENIGGKS